MDNYVVETGPGIIVFPNQATNSSPIGVELTGNPLLSNAQVELRGTGLPTISGTNAANPSADTLTATFDIAGAVPGNRDVVITPRSGGFVTLSGAFTILTCSYSLSPSGQGFDAQGGLGSFTVNTAPACGWTAVPNVSWITILPSGSKGTAKVNYVVAVNNGGPRTGTISAGGQNYNIDQSALTCTYSIGPAVAAFDASGGDSRVVVTAPAGCSRTATSNAGWLSVTSGATGAGTGAVIVHAAANSGGPRSGTVTIAGQTFSATQAAPGASACGAIDVTSQVVISDDGHSHWIPPNLYSGSITVRNGSGAVIHGPVYLVLLGEPTHHGFPYDSFLLGNQLQTTCFTSQGDYLLPISGDLPPGQTTGYSTGWITQTSGRIAYSVKVLSGTPSH